jgi:hypothetical protein
MTRRSEIAELAREIRRRIGAMDAPTTAEVRAIRREFSRRLAKADAQSVVKLALSLVDEGSGTLRFVAYELVSKHRPRHRTTDD